MPRLAVGGCSFSDRRYGIKPYGETVAKHLGFDYIHEAASAGSNYRIWRRLIKHIVNRKIVSNDIIIIQYTLIDRREAWTPVVHENTFDQEHIHEPYDGGTLLRLTPHSEQFAVNKQERQLALAHNYSSNHKFNKECFWTNHMAFAALCKQNQIKVRYLNTTYDNENRVPDIDGTGLLSGSKYLLDEAHMNQLGHDRAAQLVINTLDPTLTKSPS
jgi:hypothetical protein